MMKALVLPVLGIWALLNVALKLATGLVKVLWELLKTALDSILKILPIVLLALVLSARGIGQAVRGIGKGGHSVVRRIRRKDRQPDSPQEPSDPRSPL